MAALGSERKGQLLHSISNPLYFTLKPFSKLTTVCVPAALGTHAHVFPCVPGRYSPTGQAREATGGHRHLSRHVFSAGQRAPGGIPWGGVLCERLGNSLGDGEGQLANTSLPGGAGEGPGLIPFGSFDKCLLCPCCTADSPRRWECGDEQDRRNHCPRGTGFLVLCLGGSTHWLWASGAEVLTSAWWLVVWLRWCLFSPILLSELRTDCPALQWSDPRLTPRSGGHHPELPGVC